MNHSPAGQRYFQSWVPRPRIEQTPLTSTQHDGKNVNEGTNPSDGTYGQIVSGLEQVVGVEDALVVGPQMGADGLARSEAHLDGDLRPAALSAHGIEAAFFIHQLPKEEKKGFTQSREWEGVPDKRSRRDAGLWFMVVWVLKKKRVNEPCWAGTGPGSSSPREGFSACILEAPRTLLFDPGSSALLESAPENQRGQDVDVQPPTCRAVTPTPPLILP